MNGETQLAVVLWVFVVLFMAAVLSLGWALWSFLG